MLAAMQCVPRELFVPADAREHAYDDAALQLPFGQTISQPYVVAVICEALAPQEGDRVLDKQVYQLRAQFQNSPDT